MTILGIDPGTATVGYGVIKKTKTGMKAICYGCIKTSPKFTDGERLRKINNELGKIIEEYRPEALAVETVFFFKNLKTALPVSQAKGVILLTAAKKRVPVHEFTPLQVKLTVTGYGRAEKKNVQEKIKELLKLKEIPTPDDAADALGIAVCGILKMSKSS